MATADSTFARMGNGSDILAAAAAELSVLRRALTRSTGPPAQLHLACLLHSSTPLVPPAAFEAAFAAALDAPDALPGLCYLGHLLEPTCPARANALYKRCAAASSCPLAKYFLACNLESGAAGCVDAPLAKKLYEQVVRDAGFNLAMLRLARLLDAGAPGVPRDCLRAVSLYEQAIEHGRSTEAMDALAEMYAEGRPGLPRSVSMAARLFEWSMCQVGGSRAMVGLALLLEEGGEGVVRDVPAAVRLYEKAVEKDGDTTALNNLASLLSQGAEGVQRDLRSAIALWEVAAVKGSKHAMRSLANLLEKGDDGVPADPRRAVRLYEQIVEDSRFRHVKFNLAWLLSSNRDDVPQDTVRAAELYKQIISEDSDIHAMFNLACVFAEGRGELQQDHARAAALYERAILEGEHVYSMHSLGVMLAFGNSGVKKDVHRAIELLEGAVEAGRKEATFDLALVLSNGDDGNPVDMPRAMERYEEAMVHMDHMGAMINVSEVLCVGKHGVERNVSRAMELCERAISQGLSYDRTRLAELGILQEGALEPRDDVDAVLMREHAVGQGWHLVAMCNLAEMLLTGVAHQDMKRAMKLFEAALTDPQFPHLCEAQNLDFEDTFRVVRDIIRDPDGSRLHIEMAVRIYELLIGGAESSHAMYLLAEIFMHGTEGFSPDTGQAVCMYERAVKRHNRNAMLSLGEILMTGVKGVARNEERAIELFARVVSEGSGDHLAREAIVNLALLCIPGHDRC